MKDGNSSLRGLARLHILDMLMVAKCYVLVSENFCAVRYGIMHVLMYVCLQYSLLFCMHVLRQSISLEFQPPEVRIVNVFCNFYLVT